jgi:iron(III) transport system substrate-binding protein
MSSQSRSPRVVLAAALALAWVGASCDRDSSPPGQSPASQVVIYTSVDDVFARPLAERFQRETGIEVKLVPDTEETKSTGLVNRLIAEKDRPVADVFYSGDPMRAGVLKLQGISQPYKSPAAEGLPQQFSDPEGHWTGFSCRARVIIYNRDLIPTGQEPKSVLDLNDPKYRGKACIANPLFGTTSMHAAALFATLGPEKARRFFEDFAANGGKVLSSNGEVRRRVANGEFALGLTDTDDFNVARKEGKPVGVVYPDQEGMGTVVVPNCLVLIKGAPHESNGKRFIDWMLKPETEQALAESDAVQMPVRAGVPVPPHVMTLDKIKPMPLDYPTLAADVERVTTDFLKGWVDRNLK